MYESQPTVTPATVPGRGGDTLREAFIQLRKHIEQQIIGQTELVERLLIALLADEVVRHKLIRLPDHKAARRGLLVAG